LKAVVERMTAINSQDERTLLARGMVRVSRGEYEGGLADLRRAHEINPNFAGAIIVLSFAEATTGRAHEAEAHARVAPRLSPTDHYIGTAHLALAMAHFMLRNYDEAVRWCEPQSRFRIGHRSAVP
jgi:tetratricopeptide (TPR) repeat protein